MSSTKLFCAACLTAAVAVWVTGCPGPAAGPKATNASSASEGGEKGHDHPAHGPHGGHIIEIGNEEYHAEWTHTEDGKVTIYLLDAEVKNEVPIAAEEITIDTKVGEKATTFTLAAVDRSEGDMPKTAKFEVVDKGLLGVLEALSEKVTATLNVEINGKMFPVPITPDDHGHKH